MTGKTNVRAFRDVRREAGEVLAKNGNRLLLVQALGVCLLFVALYMLLCSCCSIVLSFFAFEMAAILLTIAAFAVITVALTLFLTLPTLYGLFYLGAQAVAGERPLLIDLFYFFTTGARYRRALAMGARPVARVCIVGVAAAILSVAAILWDPWDPIVLLVSGTLISLLLLGGLLWVLSGYSELYFVFRHPDLPVGEAVRLSKEVRPSRFSRGVRYAVGFLPWLLLGLLTCGVLWIWDVLPRMLTAYFCDCADAERAIEHMTLSEDGAYPSSDKINTSACSSAGLESERNFEEHA